MTAVAAHDGSRTASWQGDPVRSYHGQPVLKEPIWTWEIPCYFFTGGLAGCSASLAQLADMGNNPVLARRAWATAAAASATSPILLISDLGRPMRFLNMLRMFKVSSPMSVGSWLLVVTGACNSIVSLNAWTGAMPSARRIAAPAAALLGLPLSTYTAALIANTAVPAWHEAHRLLPFKFAAGAALSAGAAAVITTPTSHAGAARRLAIGGSICELAAGVTMELALGEHGRPYRKGLAGKLGWVSRACLLAGGTLLGLKGQISQRAASGAGALLLAGGLAARWQVFKAGVQSAADPAATVGPQRARIERGEALGAARRYVQAARAVRSS